MGSAGPLDVITTLMGGITTAVGLLTFLASRRDRREDQRRQVEAEQQLEAVDRSRRERVEHATSAIDVQVAYEQAQQEQETLQQRYDSPQPGRPVFERGMLLALSLAVWSIVVALANRRGLDAADPANVGFGIAISVAAAMIALRGLRQARRVTAQAAEVVWVVLLVLGAGGVITCFVVLDGYTPG